MEQVAKGESLCASEGAENEAAISFWKALKVYPQPQVRLHLLPPSSSVTVLTQSFSRTSWVSMSAQCPQTCWKSSPNLSPWTLAHPLPPSPVPMTTSSKATTYLLPFSCHNLYFRHMEFSNLYHIIYSGPSVRQLPTIWGFLLMNGVVSIICPGVSMICFKYILTKSTKIKWSSTAIIELPSINAISRCRWSL